MDAFFGHRDEENFCATVPKDGRSYSPTLFCQTVRVLKKINKPGDMIVSFSLLADKIKVSLIAIQIYIRYTPFLVSHGCVYGDLADFFCVSFSPLQTGISKRRRPTLMLRMNSWIPSCLP